VLPSKTIQLHDLEEIFLGCL